MVKYIIKMHGGNGQYIKINYKNGGMMLTNNINDSDMTVISVSGDGNCFFNSLAKANITFLINDQQITLNDETKYNNIPFIRQLLMEKAIEKYITIENYNILADNNEQIKDFIDILQPRYWMNAILINLLAEISNVDVIILNVDNMSVKLSIETLNISPNKILALVIRDGEHYNAVAINNFGFLNYSYEFIMQQRQYTDPIIKIMKNIARYRPILKDIFSKITDNTRSTLIIDSAELIKMFNVNCSCDFYILEYFISCANNTTIRNDIFENFIRRFYNLLNVADINNVIINNDNGRLVNCFKNMTSIYNDINVSFRLDNIINIHMENLSKQELSIIYTSLPPNNNYVIVYNFNDDAIYFGYNNHINKSSLNIETVNNILSLIKN